MGRAVRYDVIPRFPEVLSPEWATYVEYRNPRFKLHKNLGQAKSAITNAGHGVLYRFTRFQGWQSRRWHAVAVVNTGEHDTHPLWARRGYVPCDAVVTFVVQEAP